MVTRYRLYALCGLLVLVLSAFVSVAHAAINPEINYQGKLADTSGNAVTNASYNIRFKLYTVASGGAPIWTETLCYSSDGGTTCNGAGTDSRPSTSVGLFSVLLGSLSSLSSVNFNQTLYLGVEIGGSGTTPTWDGEMTPRKMVGSVPSAFTADKLDGLSSSAFAQVAANNTFTSQNIFTATTTTSVLLSTSQASNSASFGATATSSFSSTGALTLATALTVPNGGTGSTTLSGLLKGNGTAQVATAVAGTDYAPATGGSSVLLGNGAGGFASYTGTSCTNQFVRSLNGSGVATCATVQNTDLANSSVTITSASSLITGLGTVALGGTIFINASTSPTVGYVTATSTTLASYFPYASTTVISSTGSAYFATAGGAVGIGTTTPGNKFVLNAGNTIDGLVVDGTNNPFIRLASSTAEFGALGLAFGSSNFAGPAGPGDIVLRAFNSINKTQNLVIANAATGTIIFSTGTAPSNNTAKMTILNGGNVGIGTTNPFGLLSVVKTGGDAVADIRSITSGNAVLGITNEGQVDWAFGADRADSGKLKISTTYGAPQTSTKFTIDTSGNVGIGTTTPFTALDIFSNSGETVRTERSGAGFNYVSAFRDSTRQGLVGDLSTSGYGLWTDNATPMVFMTGNGFERMRINSVGNVGIGTTTPWQIFSVAGTAATNAIVPNGPYTTNLSAFDLGATGSRWNSLWVGTLNIGTSTFSIQSNSASNLGFFTAASGGGTQIMTITSGGSVGIGTTTPSYKLDIQSTGVFASRVNSLGTNSLLLFNDSGTTGIGPLVGSNGNSLIFGRGGVAEYMRIDSVGNVGIGTSTPTAQLSTTGTVRFSNFGAGTLTTDASGNLSVSSDERLKSIQGTFTRGLTDVEKLSPILYHWNGTSGLDQSTLYAGFSAQNVQSAIPEAVGSSTNGYLTLQDRPVIAAVVNAVKEISSVTGTFKTNLIVWFGSTSNGIGDFFANAIHAHSVIADQLCAGNVCVNQQQLAVLLAAAPAATVGTPTPPAATSSAALTLNGNNPAQWPLNAAWRDNLGALFTHDGISETIYSTSTVDTSQTGTTTAQYWAAVPGTPEWLTATREIVVPAAAASTP